MYFFVLITWDEQENPGIRVYNDSFSGTNILSPLKNLYTSTLWLYAAIHLKFSKQDTSGLSSHNIPRDVFIRERRECHY